MTANPGVNTSVRCIPFKEFLVNREGYSRGRLIPASKQLHNQCVELATLKKMKKVIVLVVNILVLILMPKNLIGQELINPAGNFSTTAMWA